MPEVALSGAGLVKLIIRSFSILTGLEANGRDSSLSCTLCGPSSLWKAYPKGAPSSLVVFYIYSMWAAHLGSLVSETSPFARFQPEQKCLHGYF